MNEYVLGFCFNSAKTHVKLIHKNHPTWQIGKLNGIGGKVEDDEDIFDAMIREFYEEAGVLTTIYNWHHFASFDGKDYECACLVTFNDEIFNKVKAQTSELISTFHIIDLPINRHLMVKNVSLLLEACLSEDVMFLDITFYD